MAYRPTIGRKTGNENYDVPRTGGSGGNTTPALYPVWLAGGIVGAVERGAGYCPSSCGHLAQVSESESEGDTDLAI